MDGLRWSDGREVMVVVVVERGDRGGNEGRGDDGDTDVDHSGQSCVDGDVCGVCMCVHYSLCMEVKEQQSEK